MSGVSLVGLNPAAMQGVSRLVKKRLGSFFLLFERVSLVRTHVFCPSFSVALSLLL